MGKLNFTDFRILEKKYLPKTSFKAIFLGDILCRRWVLDSLRFLLYSSDSETTEIRNWVTLFIAEFGIIKESRGEKCSVIAETMRGNLELELETCGHLE